MGRLERGAYFQVEERLRHKLAQAPALERCGVYLFKT